MFVHTVLFWLTDDAPGETAGKMIRDCRSKLARIPGVKALHAGAPAMTPREVVDNSYQVGLTVVLEDTHAHDVYQDHPLHKEFIQDYGKYWGRVIIYDFV